MDLERVYEELKKEDVDIHTKYQYSHRIKTKGLVKNLSLGRIWFNNLLPDDYPLVDEPVTKKVLNKIMQDIVEKYEPQVVADIFSKIQREAFRLSSIVPVSLDENAFILPDDLDKERKSKLSNEDDPIKFQKLSLEITNKFFNKLKEENNPVSIIIESGAKSSLQDLANLVVARGAIVDIADKISKPIKSSLNDGLSPEEYYIAAKESRRSLYIRSKFTAEPGYLARKVTFANANLKISQNDDCGTTRYLQLRITDSLHKSLIGRYFVNEKGNLELISPDSKIVGKFLSIRSPLFCKEKNDKICRICYGIGYKKLQDENIGILAGSVINTEGIEGFSMKVRHKATQVNFREVDLLEDLIETKYKKSEIQRYITIEKNRIVANYDSRVVIDTKDYREDELDEFSEYYLIPGIIEIEIKDENITIPIAYNYSLRLMKTENMEIDKSLIIINYEKGDVIAEQTLISTDVDMRLAIRLLDGRVKFIKDPVILLLLLHDQFPNIALVHLELIISNMFRCADNPKVQCRLKGDYKNSVIIGQADQPFVDSWLSSLAFERIGKAISSSLIDEIELKNNPLEKLMLLDFGEQGENQ